LDRIAKQSPDAFWLADAKLLKDLAKVAGDREGR
jgi:hypothetical protein